MRERGILFLAPMVRALLAGTKTQTRRLIKPGKFALPEGGGWEYSFGVGGWGGLTRGEIGGVSVYPLPRCAYGVPGDRLWVRETWQYANWTEDGYPFIGFAADGERRLCDRIPADWAEQVSDTWSRLSEKKNFDIDERAADRKWRPSIFLPRWASRITLKVTEVRVQRLQDISERDARMEGIVEFDDGRWGVGGGEGFRNAKLAYRALWIAINGPESWAANPLVWAVSFASTKGST